MNVELPIIGSPSRTETAARCHRRHMIADVLCRKRIDRHERGEDGALAFGTVLHEGVAEYWRTRDVDLALEKSRATYRSLSRELQHDQKHTLHLAEFLVRAYPEHAKLAGAHWAADHEGWEVVAIEERVILDLGADARLSFQLDRLLNHPQIEESVLIDTKSTSRMTNWWRRGWPLSLQQKLYKRAVKQHYGLEPEHYIEGILKDVPTKVEYVTLPAWDTDTLDEAMNLFVGFCQSDAEIVARSLLPDGTLDYDKLVYEVLVNTRFNPHDCFSYGRQCEAYALCESEPAYRPSILAAEYEHIEPIFLGE